MNTEIVDIIEKYRKPCLIGSTVSGEIHVGKSKKGGFPDITNTFEWPSYRGKYLNFICQIEASLLFGDESSGIVLFFWSQNNWGAQIKDLGSSVALHLDGELNRCSTLPQSEYKSLGFFSRTHRPKIWQEQAISFSESYSCPDIEEIERSLENDLDDIYHRQLEKITGFFKIGGFADIIQNVGLEVDCAKFTGRGSARSWKLLFQIDSCEDMNWGDGGRLYWYIEESDFRAKDVSNLWMHMQCH